MEVLCGSRRTLARGSESLLPWSADVSGRISRISVLMLDRPVPVELWRVISFFPLRTRCVASACRRAYAAACHFD